MFKLLLTKTIHHTWKLANIVPIQKHNKDTNKGTSYRPISLLSLITKTLEKSLLPTLQQTYQTHHATRVQNTILYSDGTTPPLFS